MVIFIKRKSQPSEPMGRVFQAGETSGIKALGRE